jgi:ribosome biogenesis GTPase
VLAANADTVLVVEGMVPDPDLGRLERLLALAWASGARPMVALTKADLVGVPQHLVEDVRAVAPGVEVIAVVAPSGTGLERLRALLGDRETIAVVGASGVGKSTLVNALLGADVMETRELAAANKGRHTTVSRELHLVPGGGALIDTPGLRGVGLAGGEGLDDVFAEVEELGEQCRFDDCAHTGEPGCAVLAAVDAGTLSERRLASYRKLLREQRWQASRTDARLRALRRRSERKAGRAVL